MGKVVNGADIIGPRPNGLRVIIRLSVDTLIDSVPIGDGIIRVPG